MTRNVIDPKLFEKLNPAKEAAEKKGPAMEAEVTNTTEDLFATAEIPQPVNLAKRLGELATALRAFQSEVSEYSEGAIMSAELMGKFKALQWALGKGEASPHKIVTVSEESRELGEKTLNTLIDNMKKVAEILRSNRAVLSPDKEKEVNRLMDDVRADYETLNTIGRADKETDCELAELNGMIKGLQEIQKVLLRRRGVSSQEQTAA